MCRVVCRRTVPGYQMRPENANPISGMVCCAECVKNKYIEVVKSSSWACVERPRLIQVALQSRGTQR